jgi:hypothetical protein
MKKIQRIYSAKSVAKEIGISHKRFYDYIRGNLISNDFYYISKKGMTFFLFSEDSLNKIKAWHKSFKQSKSRKLEAM